MRKISTLILAIVLCCTVFAQPNEVSLTVNGEGRTKDEAIDNALRYAIEQTYGTFVSANTSILNDDVVRDEILTVSSGKIISYEEIASILADGIYNVSLKVKVSLTKLIHFAQNHGSSCELNGEAFSANKKLFQLYKSNAQKVFSNFIEIIERTANSAFNYSISVSEPQVVNGQDKIDITTYLTANENTKLIGNYIVETLYGITLSDKESRQFRSMGCEMYRYFIGSSYKDNFEYAAGAWEIVGRWSYFPLDLGKLNQFFAAAANNFTIKDNLGKTYPAWIAFGECIKSSSVQSELYGPTTCIQINLNYKKDAILAKNFENYNIPKIELVNAFDIQHLSSQDIELPAAKDSKKYEAKTTYFAHYNTSIYPFSKETDDVYQPGANKGVFLGVCGNIGAYTRVNFGREVAYSSQDSSNHTDKTENNGMYMAGGLLFRPTWCVYSYVGIGYSTIQPKRFIVTEWGSEPNNTKDDTWELKNDYGKKIGITGEAGIVLRYTYMSLSLGAAYNSAGAYLNFGVGVAI